MQSKVMNCIWIFGTPVFVILAVYGPICMVIFLEVLLRCGLSILTLDFEQPISINILWDLFPFEY
jgi:hypothetical protein